MKLDEATFRQLVAEARLAPSVHNTQPTRWRLTPEGHVLVLEDPARRLAVGDPDGRDIGVSHGCAVEGFSLAASTAGLTTVVHPEAGAVARLKFQNGGEPDALAAFVSGRRTYRGRFRSTADEEVLAGLAQTDLTVTRDRGEIADLAALYDEASLRWFRNAPYRAELLSWMRLSSRHPDRLRDGLAADAMEMSFVEAMGAGLVLRPGVFEALDRVGLARPLVAEAPVVRTAPAIALFHRPVDEAPFETGRAFYRQWLAFTRAGLSGSPMSVLADDALASNMVSEQFAIPSRRRLVTAFRLGAAPARISGEPPRLPMDVLVV